MAGKNHSPMYPCRYMDCDEEAIFIKKCLNVAVELYVGKSHVQFLDEFNFNCLMLKLGGIFTYE